MFKIFFLKCGFIAYFSIVMFAIFINNAWSESLSIDYFSTPIRQPETLDDAIKEIKGMISDGKSREEISKRVTEIGDEQIKSNNDPLERPISGIIGDFQGSEFLKWRDNGGVKKQPEEMAKWAWDKREGQCAEHSALVYYILKTAGAKNIRIFRSNNYVWYKDWGRGAYSSHDFPVWGLKPDVDPSKKENWTDKVFIPDSWQGITLSGKEAFKDKHCGHGWDVTEERDKQADARCGVIRRGQHTKVPACSSPPFCFTIGSVHIDGWCKLCGSLGEPCCENDACRRPNKCINSICTKKKESDKTKTSNNVKSSQTNLPIKQEDETKVQERIKDSDNDNDSVNDNNDACPGTPPGMVVDSKGCSDSQKDTDEDGVKDANDACPGTPSNEVVDSKGCADSQKDTDKDGVNNTDDKCPEDPEKIEPGECGCLKPDDDANLNGVADCKETKKSGCSSDSDCPEGYVCRFLYGIRQCKKKNEHSGCSSDNDCPQGYVCKLQSGQCGDPFDDKLDERNQIMADNGQERERKKQARDIADANLNPDRSGYSSTDLDEDLDETQEFVGTECNDHKSCPAGHTCEDGQCVDEGVGCNADSDCPPDQICTEGNCIKENGHHDDEYSNGGTGQKPPADNPECSRAIPCENGFICKNGHCVKKRHRFDCRKGDKCKRGYQCDRKTGQCKKLSGGGGHHPNPPNRQPSELCAGGSCCKGHTLYCKFIDRKGEIVGPYPKTSLDVNMDNLCDICNRPYYTKQRKKAPGLKYILRDNYHSGCSTSY